MRLNELKSPRLKGCGWWGVLRVYLDGELELQEIGLLEAYGGGDVKIGKKPGDNAHDTVTSLGHDRQRPSYSQLRTGGRGGGNIGDTKEADADESGVGRGLRLDLLEGYDKLMRQSRRTQRVTVPVERSDGRPRPLLVRLEGRCSQLSSRAQPPSPPTMTEEHKHDNECRDGGEYSRQPGQSPA